MQTLNKKIAISLFVLVALLLIMNFFPARISETISGQFKLDAERNIPTWYSSMLLFLVSLVSFILFILNNYYSKEGPHN
jgi:hypothetical protein